MTDRLVAPEPQAQPATPVAPVAAATVPAPAPTLTNTTNTTVSQKPAEATKGDQTKQDIEKMKDQLAKSDKGVDENLKKASEG